MAKKAVAEQCNGDGMMIPKTAPENLTKSRVNHGKTPLGL
jgi:hypothetical protein